ncbi:MAG: hypothetical protein GY820_06380 [Gammaproteobacteria bacterium]|nr:hypothetical protein [Gammaproteobacteria bacterium]
MSKFASFAYLIIIQNGRRLLQTCAAHKRKHNVLHVKINSGGDAEEHAGIGGIEGRFTRKQADTRAQYC